MRPTATLLLIPLLPLTPIGSAPAAERQTIVACAPGHPGSTEQAQPTMDALARAIERAARWREGQLGAVYHEQLEPGLERLALDDAAVAMVPLPFYLEFRRRLSLQPLLQAVPLAGPEEIWSLVARREAPGTLPSLAGWEVIGTPGYAPRFVLRVALADWGPAPADLRVGFDSSLLAALRRAAAGERVAVLLDRAQTGALSALPFADRLEVVARSSPLPASLVCTLGGRMSEEDSRRLAAALLGLHDSDSGRELLASLRLARFERVPVEALAGLERAFESEPH